MKNAADIAYRENIRLELSNTLDRKQRGTYHGKETTQGLKMAIAYIDSLTTDILTERQLYHSVRLAHYRGKETDHRAITTA